MKLYYGGFGDYKDYTVADCEESAIKQLGIKINAPFLPITAQEISEIDGYQICVVVEKAEKAEIPVSETQTEPEICEETTLRHCKKCDFTCENQADLMRHYRENHPKGD